MAANNFDETISSLFKGMDSFITTKTVVGEAIHVGDTIILPLADVSFYAGAGAFAESSKNNGGGGMGGKIKPAAVLVIQDGSTRMIQVKGPEGIAKIIDMVPDVVDRLSEILGSKDNDQDEPVEETITE